MTSTATLCSQRCMRTPVRLFRIRTDEETAIHRDSILLCCHTIIIPTLAGMMGFKRNGEEGTIIWSMVFPTTARINVTVLSVDLSHFSARCRYGIAVNLYPSTKTSFVSLQYVSRCSPGSP